MTTPFSLLLIKPLSVGRGDASVILSMILRNCPVSLRQFREWVICDTTLFALTRPTASCESNLEYQQEKIHPPRKIPTWICLFIHRDGITNPFTVLDEYCGPLDRNLWLPHHLRYKFSEFSQSKHPTDTVVHLALPERADYEANMLFPTFDKDRI